MSAREKTGHDEFDKREECILKRRVVDQAGLGRVIVPGVALVLGAFLTQTASTQTASRQPTPAAVSHCAPPAPGAPMFVTGDCADPRFNDPVW